MGIKRAVLGFAFLLILNFSAVLICAEKMDIEAGDSYVPGQEVKFKITLYDDKNNKISGKIDYVLQDYYKGVAIKGSIGSGEGITYALPENAWQGPWKITAKYRDVEINRLFNVGELEKAEIRLEGDVLILKNVGNAVYDKKILIYIGNTGQTAQIYLDIGQEKRIRLTAPTGKYDIRVIEGNEENILEFEGIGLTGNAIGLERVLEEKGFWRRYPMVSLFLGALALVTVVVVILKSKKRTVPEK